MKSSLTILLTELPVHPLKCKLMNYPGLLSLNAQ